ncbi:MAG TPA: chorismate synthase, partial [bacterium]|nr:chorismate synthase [bacterium]
MLRFLTAGESHGRGLVAIVEGMPSGMSLIAEDINPDLKARQGGYGRGGRMKIESDQVQILSGVRWGQTLGSPIALLIENKDFANWETKMSVHPEHRDPTIAIQEPRPGHADLVGLLKYNRPDIRDILERASARETAARVAVGAVCRKLLQQFSIESVSHVVSIGTVVAPVQSLTFEEIRARQAASDLKCADPKAEMTMKVAIDLAKHEGDSLGGVVEVRVKGLPVGLGSHVHWDRKLDGKLAQSLMSIQAIKGVEIGLGFQSAFLDGSKVHDEISTDGSVFLRLSNNAGGLEGGMTTGEDLVLRAAMKPIATLQRPKKTINPFTKQPASASTERSDVCAVTAAAVVAEAATLFTVAQAFCEKFGGDSLKEM